MSTATAVRGRGTDEVHVENQRPPPDIGPQTAVRIRWCPPVSHRLCLSRERPPRIPAGLGHKVWRDRGHPYMVTVSVRTADFWPRDRGLPLWWLAP